MCALAAASFSAVEIAGAHDPVQMPTAPHLVPILAATGGALLVTTADLVTLSLRARTILSVLCGAGMLAGSLLAIPHTALIVIISLASRISGGVGPFDVTPQWPVTAAHLITILAAVSLAVWVVVEQRRHRLRCLECGRVDPAPSAARWPALPWLAALAVAGSLPYGLLKAGWALGWTGGLIGHEFSDVSFTSPGFGDTAVLTCVSVIVTVSMGARLSAGWRRPVLIAVGAIGSFMLLPVAAVGIVDLVPLALGLRSIDDPEIADWAFLVVYGSFVVWGAALASLTIGYWRTTGRSCPRHALTTTL